MKYAIVFSAAMLSISAFAADTLSNGTTVDTKGEALATNDGVQNGLTQNSKSVSNLFNFPQAVQPGMVAGNTRCTNHGVDTYAFIWNFVSFSNPSHIKDTDCDTTEDIKYLTITCQFKSASDLLVLHMNKKYPELHATATEGAQNLKLEDCFKKPVPAAASEKVSEPKVEVRVERVVEKTVSRTLMLDAGALFYFNKHELHPEARSYLKTKLEALSGMQRVEVTRVSGHTDNVGSVKYNQKLSEQRANAVASLIRSLGYEVSNAVITGYGELHPIVTNSTETGRSMNRRVEIEVTGVEQTTTK